MPIVNGTMYHAETPSRVIALLEKSRLFGNRYRLSLGDAKTGKDWLEECEVEGSVGRSTGSIKVPLMIANVRSTGGGAILDHCIVRIKQNGHVVWQHSSYHHGKFTLRACNVKFPKGVLRAEVLVDGEVHARFKDEKAAQRWLKKME